MPIVTRVEAADPFYGDDCIHGGWTVEAFNGTTMPPTAGEGRPTSIVPTAISLGSNPLDPTSTYAIRASGSGQENTGGGFSYAQVAARLNTLSAAQIGTVDASRFTGIQFYAIVNTGPTGARLTVANLFTDPSGGRCTTAPGATGCYDHPGAQLAVSTTWTRYQIPFDSLVQAGFGNPSPLGAAFPKAAIVLVSWDLGIPAMGAIAPWELWIDDLTFY